MNDLIRGGQGKSADEVWDSAVIAVLTFGGMVCAGIAAWMVL